MRRASRALPWVLLALTLGTTALAPTAAHADAGRHRGPVRAVAARSTPSQQIQHVRVNWRGSWKHPVYTKTATVPGIGDLDLRCRPSDTEIDLWASDRTAETQMWMQKYETKNGQYAVSVKTARIYRYANADDDGQGGTGSYAHEGLNQQAHIENRSQDGYMYGVISQRPGREASGATSSPVPVTTFELDWNWNGFDHPQKYRSCTIDATFTTQLATRSLLTWHGDDDAAPTEQTTAVAGIGSLTLSCPHDRTSAPTVWLTPDSSDSSLFIQDVRGEGLVTNQRQETSLDYDQDTGLLGPYPLPSNGSLRMRVSDADTSHWILVSSLWKTNDPRPQRNLCEVAAGWYDR